MTVEAVQRFAERFAEAHKEGIGFFLMASIVTMRKKLPTPFCKIDALEWSYEWFRDALLTLLSLRGPHGPEVHTTERDAIGSDGSTERSKETTITGPTTVSTKADV